LGGDRRGIVEEFVWYEEAGARAVTCEEEGGREEERAGPKPKRRGEMGLLSDALSVLYLLRQNWIHHFLVFHHGEIPSMKKFHV
jgi:hypothetical protein